MTLNRLRMTIAALALVLGLGGVIPAMAQDDASVIPKGATDGASVSYIQESGEDPTAPIYGFIVFTFDDEDAASDAMEAFPQQFADSVAAAADPSETSGTPDASAELMELQADDLDGLDDLGDEAHAYRIDFGNEDVGSLAMSILSIRYGKTIQVWTSIVIDFTFAFDDAAATEPATEQATEPVDPLAGATDLVEIATDWFGGDKPEDGDLIDQLPTADALPDGYVEADRSETLEELEDSSDAAVATQLAA